MNAQKFIAAATVFIAAGSAFAADAPVAAASTASAVFAANLNLPAVSTDKNAGQSRAEVRAGAVEFVQHHKTALAVQLDHYKN